MLIKPADAVREIKAKYGEDVWGLNYDHTDRRKSGSKASTYWTYQNYDPKAWSPMTGSHGDSWSCLERPLTELEIGKEPQKGQNLWLAKRHVSTHAGKGPNIGMEWAQSEKYLTPYRQHEYQEASCSTG
jgi:hypothetical protein